ncbi:hypothetical protein Tcan_13920 [Toxocara canis]|uniref:Uncharacterized protein n=1 Tax=Toxocara canis TaxID=6265 RepID=A0A0B2W1A9_TOXCA|nr:hypothetical protein Tcan_13920 [Toxocara canis]
MVIDEATFQKEDERGQDDPHTSAAKPRTSLDKDDEAFADRLKVNTYEEGDMGLRTNGVVGGCDWRRQ